MEKCEVNHRMTYAIVYECVLLIAAALAKADSGDRNNDAGGNDAATNGAGTNGAGTNGACASIDPGVRVAMLEAALGCVGKFLDSPSADVRFVGLKALKAVMKADAKSVREWN